MNVCIGPKALIISYGLEEGIKMTADAGFEAIDYPLYTEELSPWDKGFFKDPFDAEFVAHFRHTAKVIADHGIEVFQTHAPFLYPNRSDPKEYAENQQ